MSTHLKEDSLLELEVLSHDVGDIGRLDREGDGYIRLFEDVVHLHQIMVVLQSKAKKSRWWCWHGNAITLKSQTTLPLVNLVTSTVTSSTCSAMSPSLKGFDYNVQLNVNHVGYGTISKKHLNFWGDHDYVHKHITLATSPWGPPRWCLPTPRTQDSQDRSGLVSIHSPVVL